MWASEYGAKWPVKVLAVGKGKGWGGLGSDLGFGEAPDDGCGWCRRSGIRRTVRRVISGLDECVGPYLQ